MKDINKIVIQYRKGKKQLIQSDQCMTRDNAIKLKQSLMQFDNVHMVQCYTTQGTFI